MFFDQYTEDARRAIAIAKEEAANIGSPVIEAEHLLLGIARAIEPDLKESLRLKEVEDVLRADFRANAQFESHGASADLPLSNPSKRILAYAVEEAVRLNSPGIGSGHMLLGVLRESESSASRLLIAHNVDLARARQIVAALGTKKDAGKSFSPIGLASRINRRYWIGIAGQLTLIVLLGVVIANSAITGPYLLVIATAWFGAVFAWMKLGPSSFFLSLGKQNRAKVTVIYAFGWLYQVFMFGWLLPLSIGIYRVTVR
jgi:Clp amino terminal domain, pathogenicity island component